MSHSRISKRTRGAALATVVGVSAIVALPSSASAAAPDACDASALQLSLLGGQPLDPVHANPAFSACASDDGSLLNVPDLLGIVSAQAVDASTRKASNAEALSDTTVVGLGVGLDGALADRLTSLLLTDPNGIGNTLLTQINGSVGPLLNPVLGLLGFQGLDLAGLSGVLSGTLSSTLESTLPDVVSAGVIQSTARAQCVAGTAQLSGSSQYTDLRVLGQGIDPNAGLDQLLNIDSTALNLGALLGPEALLRGIKINPSTPLGGVLGLLAGPNTTLWDVLQSNNGVVQTTVNLLLVPLGTNLAALSNDLVDDLQPILDGIEVNVPAGLLHVQVTPRSQSIAGDQLTQRTLALSVSALNQPILAGALAQARVGAGAPGCAPPVVPPVDPPSNPPNDPPKNPPSTTPKAPLTDPIRFVKDPERFSSPEAEAVLQCSKAPATLIDVYGDKGRTYVQGVAERRFVGKTATIYLRSGKKKVGTAKIAKSGLFSTHVALPPSRIRYTNAARYYAVVGGKRTKALKFARRMLTTSITARNGRVTVQGRVLPPRLSKQAPVVIKQRITCTSFRKVATVKPDAQGRFKVSVKAPKNKGAAIYRAQTTVPKTLSSPKRYATYTLPRVVGL